MTQRPSDLITGAVRLVALTPEDAEAVIAVGLPLGEGPLSELEASRGWPHADTADALGMHAAHGHTGPYCCWLVVAGGSVVGDVGCHGGPGADGVVEIGYGIAGPSRRKGYATAAVRALVAHLAEQPELTAIRATTSEGNEPSQRLLEGLGFEVVGREGGDRETLVYERMTGARG